MAMGQARKVMDRLTKAATEEHNLNSMADMYTDNAVLMTPDAGEVRGRDQIIEYWRPFIEGFPDARWEPINKLEADSTAIDEGYIVGTHTAPMRLPSGETVQPTGKRVKLRECDVATVENGKIVEHHMYFDELEFMRQLGMSN
jgi:predicted ester cyclase